MCNSRTKLLITGYLAIGLLVFLYAFVTGILLPLIISSKLPLIVIVGLVSVVVGSGIGLLHLIINRKTTKKRKGKK